MNLTGKFSIFDCSKSNKSDNLIKMTEIFLVITSKLEVDPLGEEGKEEKIGRKEGRKEIKIKKK